ncbi:MAG: ABC transporter permease [Solirubrobacteraceae bacterium]
MSTIEQPPPTAGAPMRSRADIGFRFAPRYRVVWIALAALMLLTALSASEVYRTDSLSLVTALAGVLAIAAAGQLLVIMSGGIDLSVPAVMTLAAGIVVHQSNGLDSRLGGAIVEVILVCGLVGLINGFLVAVVRLNAMIVTLAMTGVIGGVMVLWIGTTFSTTGQVAPKLVELTSERVGFLSVVAVIGIGIIVLLALLLRSTAVGRSYVAAGTNRVAAEIIGVRVVWYEMAGYVLAAILYGAAGLFLAGLLTTPDFTLGDPYQLSTIIAVALGGAALAGGPASLICTIGGCFFVALLGQFLQAKSYSGGVSQITNGVVLILAVAMVTVGSGGRFRMLTGRLRRR